MPRDITISREPVERLASLVGAHLRGVPAPSVPIDDAFVRFATARHGMGPLLLAAAGSSLGPRARSQLENYRRTLARNQAIEALQMELVSSRFRANGVSWLILKGTPLGRLLYADASLRPSVDIDILVPPRDFAPAVDVLRGLGWSMAAGGGLLPHGVALRLLRDIDLYAPGNVRIHMELHQRPLFNEPFDATGADLFASAESHPYPAPALGPALAYYVFAHGALSSWCRLKWLTDFVQVLAKLDGGGIEGLLARAGERRTTASLAASILLVNELFARTVPPELVVWAGAYPGTSSSRRRDAFWSALTSTDVRTATPLASRSSSFLAQFRFYQSMRSRLRLMVTAPLSTLVRKASGFAHNP